MKNISIHDLQADTPRVLKQLKRQGTTALTDADGERTAVLLDAAAYERLQARVAFLEGIARGEQAIREGRVVSHAQAKKKMARWLKKAQ